MGALGVPLSGRIGAPEAALPGRALAGFTDLGLGQRLRGLLAEPDGPAPQWVLAACIQVLHEWDWAQRPAAVVAIPSLRHPQLVASVAAEIAARGRLVDLGSMTLRPETRSEEPAANSAFRLRQVIDRFALTPSQRDWLSAHGGAVLLVDDLTDTRWTQTVAARALRLAGASAVLPLALAAVA